MPTYFMLSANETSAFQFTAASQGQIMAALDAVNMAGRSVLPAASWYSPTRIDRANPVFNTTSTRVQRVLAVNDGVVDPLTKAREIAANMKQALDHAGDDAAGLNYQTWTNVSVTPFTDAQFGSLDSWHSGSATVSPTSDQFPSQLPNLPSVGDWKFLLGAVGVGLGVYLLWPALSGVRTVGSAAVSKATKARSNPGRKVVAVSEHRYRASATEKRLYGGSTVTQFLVHHEGEQDYKRVMGYGKTPGDRKTDAIRRFRESHG